MIIYLPEDLQRYVQSEVQSGRFASPDEAITEALRPCSGRKSRKQSVNGSRSPQTS